MQAKAREGGQVTPDIELVPQGGLHAVKLVGGLAGGEPEERKHAVEDLPTEIVTIGRDGAECVAHDRHRWGEERHSLRSSRTCSA
jgi:hypothetical protein